MTPAATELVDSYRHTAKTLRADTKRLATKLDTVSRRVRRWPSQLAQICVELCERSAAFRREQAEYAAVAAALFNRGGPGYKELAFQCGRLADACMWSAQHAGGLVAEGAAIEIVAEFWERQAADVRGLKVTP